MMKPSKKSSVLKSTMEYAASIGLFMIIWQIYVMIADVPQFVLPSPIEVMKSFINMFTSGMIFPHLGITTVEVVIGFVLGGLLGMILGYIFVKVDFIKSAFMPYLIFAQTAPKIALVPLFVVWFGIGMVSKLVLIISMVVFPVMAGMILGIESMPKDAKNLMTVLGASRWQLFSKMEMPYALPALFSSFKIGIVQAVIGAIVAEWMSAKQGLGYILTYASSTYDTPMLMAGIIATILLGIITYEIVNVLDSKLLYWHESKNQ